MADAYFAAGCFWGVEHKFSQVAGVLRTEAGYMGGDAEEPTYKTVCSGKTGHAEAVHVEYDPDEVSFKVLASVFFSIHDPTTKNRQGPDVGSQYRSAIFYTSEDQMRAAEKMIAELNSSNRYQNEIVTELAPAGIFWLAEEYHQKYYKKNRQGSCGSFC